MAYLTLPNVRPYPTSGWQSFRTRKVLVISICLLKLTLCSLFMCPKAKLGESLHMECAQLAISYQDILHTRAFCEYTRYFPLYSSFFVVVAKIPVPAQCLCRLSSSEHSRA